MQEKGPCLARAGLEPDEFLWGGKRARLVTPVKPGNFRDKPENRCHRLRLKHQSPGMGLSWELGFPCPAYCSSY